MCGFTSILERKMAKKMAQDRPKTAQDGPMLAPGQLKKGPKTAQDGPKTI